MAAADANEYPVGYVKNGYVCVFVSKEEKAWKKIIDLTNLEKEESIIEKHAVNIRREGDTYQFLTDDMLVIEKPKEKKASSEYHAFIRQYLEKTDQTKPYKERFKEAVSAWHVHKSKRKHDITNS